MSETTLAMELAFKAWWDARVAEGYQYGSGPLATVKFGFMAGYAAASGTSLSEGAKALDVTGGERPALYDVEDFV